MRWNVKDTYQEVFSTYLANVEKHYGNSVIVFDGYSPSTKDHEPQRRSLTSNHAPNINIDVNNKSHPDQTKFLANDLNKSQFIDSLAKILKTDGQLVHQSESDADILIASTVLTIARTEPATVVADDTDIAILLFHHYNYSLTHSFDLKRRKENLQ